MENLNKYLCGGVMPILLLILGLFFAFKIKFFYILHPIKTTRLILKNQKGGFKSLSVALAGTLGVGNIVGVSSAIILGGAGSIFWMWLSALCAMSVKYVEVYLSIKFRKQREKEFYGGAPYYINEGLKTTLGAKGAYALSILFAVFCVINSLTTGNLVQINAVSSLSPASPLFLGICFTVLAFLSIVGGIKRICKITSFLIPFLTLSYIIICIIIIVSKITEIPYVINTILSDAFCLNSAISGLFGYSLATTIRYGVCRGVLSNEAGCGTSPTAHASSECTNPHAQGCLGILEVFIDTILLCTLTAFVILLYGSQDTDNPMSLVLFSFEHFTGSLGKNLIAFISILFAFATVICQFFYGAESMSYISKSKIARNVYLFIFLLVLLIGSVIPMWIMWQISDLAIAIMTILNLACLYLLRKNL